LQNIKRVGKYDREENKIVPQQILYTVIELNFMKQRIIACLEKQNFFSKNLLFNDGLNF
jgi:hypothetical protein